MPAPLPPSESERLQALSCYALLDTPPEPEFERITALAAKIFHVPIALVSLVDEHRQWFKSRRGLEQSETARNLAFCGYTILENCPFIVPDTRADARFVDHPMVTGAPRIRFYAGTPLTTRDGANIGSLCLIDIKPRTFTEDEAGTLTQLGAMIMTAVEARLTEERLRREVAVHQSTEARRMAVLDAALDGIITINHEGRVIELNRAAETIFGYTQAQAVGQELAELIVPPALRAAHRRGMAHFLATGEGPVLNRRLKLPAVRASGEEFPAELAITRIAISGPPVFTGHIRDITERKQAQKSLEDNLKLLRAIINGTDNAIFIKDCDSRYLLINPAGAALLGTTPEAVVSQDDSAFFSSEDAAQTRAFDQEIMQSGESRTYESSNIIAGSEHVFLSTKSSYRDAAGNLLGVIGIVREVTAQRRAAEALREAKEEAEKANAAKSEFLSRMSHELRTPLNAILGFGQLMEMDASTPHQIQSVTHVLKAGRHLLGLIDEVLAISRIEARQMHLSLEPISVGEIVRECLSLVSQHAADRGVRLTDRCGASAAYVQADHQRLRQVLLNLLSNAIKYNCGNGEVTIDCLEVHKNGATDQATLGLSHLRIEVIDTGQGLSAEEIGRLFVPFERLWAEQTSTEGTGLGLALSKGLIEAMGGSIGVHSVSGEGSTFWIELPLASELRKQAKHEAAMAPNLLDGECQGCVLYIEDNLSNLELVETLLERSVGVDLLSAQHGTLGIEVARARRPDLILLDLHLPDLPGWEVLKALQAHPTTRDIPVVVISADATSKRVERLLKAGAQAYLTKPLDVRVLLETMREHLKPAA